MKKQKQCVITECKNKYYAKKYCHHHYDLNRRNGSPLIMKKEIHGKRFTPEYRSWAHLKDRCLNPKDQRYSYYGGRGIKVCDRWLNSFTNFFDDMGAKPTPKHSIDRIDNDGNYEPSNCRWATTTQQAFNKRMDKDTKSIYQGVRWNKYVGKWQVYFRNKYVGVFVDPSEAIKKRKQIEQVYLGTIA